MHDYQFAGTCIIAGALFMIASMISSVAAAIRDQSNVMREQVMLFRSARAFDEARARCCDLITRDDRQYVLDRRAEDEAFEEEYRAASRLQWRIQRATAKSFDEIDRLGKEDKQNG